MRDNFLIACKSCSRFQGAVDLAEIHEILREFKKPFRSLVPLENEQQAEPSMVRSNEEAEEAGEMEDGEIIGYSLGANEPWGFELVCQALAEAEANAVDSSPDQTT